MAKILVVDDHPTNRALAVALVERAGQQVYEATDGAEALDLVRSEHPDLVICDIVMPTMDGYEFVRRLRGEPEIANTEVIFYSAYYRERQARRLAAACGVSRVVRKPCVQAEFLRVIDEALAHQPSPTPITVPDGFSAEHLRLMSDELSAKAEELEAGNHRFTALIDLTLQLASESDLRLLLDQMCRGARDLVGAKYAVLAVREKGDDGHTHVSLSGIPRAVSAALPPPDIQGGLLGEVFGDRQSRRLANSGDAAEYFGLPPGYPPARHGLAAPVASLNQTYGWIFLADKLVDEQFAAEDEHLLTALAAQVGRIYENGSLYHELRQHTKQLQTEVAERERAAGALQGMVRRLEALHQLDYKILEAHLPREIAIVALRHLAGLMPLWTASVIVFDRGSGASTVLAREGGPAFLFEPGARELLNQYRQADLDAMRRGRICTEPDLAASADDPPLLTALLRQGLRSSLRVPILFEGTLVGVLSLGSDQPDFFTAEHADIARAIVDQLGMALQQANLRERIIEQSAELERRVAERTAQLEAANRDLEAFSYSVAHDLAAPLRGMSGFANMLKADLKTGQLDALPGYSDRIIANAAKMGDLINGLLDVARVSHGRLDRESVDLGVMVEEVLAEQKARAHADVFVGQLPAIYGDRTSLRQLWTNLISNALKYSAKRSKPVIAVNCDIGASEVIFRVHDNGAGFDP